MKQLFYLKVAVIKNLPIFTVVAVESELNSNER
jgi:hypothetical protein